MRSEPDVLEYDSVDDLEQTIEQVYERVERLDGEMDNLLEQVGAFLDYGHDIDEFKSSADYVSKNLPHEALPELAMEHAGRELENPQQADNWDRLEEAAEKAEHLADRWRTAYSNLWNEFGYSGEELQDETEGIPPVKHLIHLWEEEPHRLFRQEESYESDDTLIGSFTSGHNPGLTMARYFDIESPTSKQSDDITRGKVLERESRDMQEAADMSENPQFWRENLGGKAGFSRWVNKEKLGKVSQR